MTAAAEQSDANGVFNPMGTDGFEFVEYAHSDPETLGALFERMGFTAVAKHRTKNVTLYRQNDINFILNGEPDSQAEAFHKEHGPSANAMAFRVKDVNKALAWAKEQGAEVVEGTKVGPMELCIPAIKGIGDSYLYLVDRYAPHDSIYSVDFKPIEGAPQNPTGVGLEYIDHLTHNVFRGNMDKWAGFYERIFNFREIRFFDIEGKLTGLKSRAMTSPCGKIRIPINESADDKSQIEEYLREYKGEGIQHIALSTGNIYETVEELRTRGVDFMDTPDTYYEKVDERMPGHGEDLARMQKNRILIDGAPGAREGDPDSGILLQIFTNTVIGPIFYEIIQRKGNEGFGEGNFQALFDSIEEDQVRRGVISAE